MQIQFIKRALELGITTHNSAVDITNTYAVIRLAILYLYNKMYYDIDNYKSLRSER